MTPYEIKKLAANTTKVITMDFGKEQNLFATLAQGHFCISDISRV
jgi:hypothetical protein